MRNLAQQESLAKRVHVATLVLSLLFLFFSLPATLLGLIATQFRISCILEVCDGALALATQAGWLWSCLVVVMPLRYIDLLYYASREEEGD